MKNINQIVSLVALVLLLAPISVLAEHKSAVAGKVIDSTDPGITAAHGEVCAITHYHGELDGVADPAPDGCGHGEVAIIAHGDGDGETVPPPPVVVQENWFMRTWHGFTAWVSSLNREDAKNVVDVVAESNGIPPPGTVSDSVDIVVEATPSIMENRDNVTEYRESIDPENDNMGIYRPAEEGLEEGSVSQRFFRWFSSLTD